MYVFNRFLLIVLVLAVSGCGFGKQAQLDSYVASEKAQLPKILFADVEVIDMATGESEIIYFCAANGLNEAAATAAKNQLVQKAGSYVKSNRDALKRLIDAKIKMTFVVKQDSGNELFRASINPWDY